MEREARRLYHSDPRSHRRRRAASHSAGNRNGQTRLEGKYHRPLRDRRRSKAAGSTRRISLSTVLKCARASRTHADGFGCISGSSRNCPDIVHAHLPHASLLARWSRLAAPVRVVIDTIHSPATGGVLRWLGYPHSTALPDVVTAVSRAAADPWLSSGMVNEGRARDHSQWCRSRSLEA